MRSTGISRRGSTRTSTHGTTMSPARAGSEPAQAPRRQPASPAATSPPDSIRASGVVRRAAHLRKQPARPALDEEHDSDQHEDLSENCAGIGLEQFVDDPHGHPADERAPEVSDAAEDDDH